MVEFKTILIFFVLQLMCFSFLLLCFVDSEVRIVVQKSMVKTVILFALLGTILLITTHYIFNILH